MLRGIYTFITNEKNIALFRKCDSLLRKVGGNFYVKTLGQLKYRMRFGKNSHQMTAEEQRVGQETFCVSFEKPVADEYTPLISVLISPELDYAKGLEEIHRQTYKNVEILAPEEGIAQAKGNLLWVLTEGTLCEEDFLEKMVPLFAYQSVLLAFCAHGMIGGERETLSMQYMTAHDMLQEILTEGNPFATISGALIRMGVDLQDFPEETSWLETGGNSWAPLLCAKRGGVVAYTRETTSWHREGVAQELGLEFRKKLQEQIAANTSIIMACYALRSGGGETFPIHLANALKQKGVLVTILNFDLEEREERIAHLINSSIPVVNMRHTDDMGLILYHLGGDIVHSHHATVDYALSMWLAHNLQVCKQVITLHGMYETITDEDCDRVIRTTQPVTRKYAYVADKNLDCFRQRDLYREDQFVKMPNGLPQAEPVVLQRDNYHIGENDFIFVLASRGIPEKGWKEAIEALQIAQQSTDKKLQLILLGDGECRETLEKQAPLNVHFMGTVSNVRDYFAMGDAGLLPSMYAGESSPLVVMECLMCGRPVIATDIGEVSNQLQDGEGHMAGMLLTLHKGKVDVAELAECMRRIVEDRELYQQLKEYTVGAKEKFDIGQVADDYMELYHQIIEEH